MDRAPSEQEGRGQGFSVLVLTQALRHIAIAASAFALLAACSGETAPPADPEEVATRPASPSPEPECPLTGLPAGDVDVKRPAVALKIENNPQAYPLSGIQKAEVVYEELVEGGQTRFMAIFHCTDAKKAGPVRSTRIVDAAIMSPITRILAGAGGNEIVRRKLEKANIILIDEEKAKKAMRRIPRSGIGIEHTLYADTAALRTLGSKRFDKAPDEVFEFGNALQGGKAARTITITFSPYVTVTYRWIGSGWKRFDRGSPLPVQGGRLQIDNVIIEEHEERNARGIVDVEGNPSPEIVDVVGTGRAVVFRDGRAYVGRWVRKEKTDPVAYQTRSGEPIPLKPGTVWIELVPNRKGELKGEFSFSRR